MVNAGLAEDASGKCQEMEIRAPNDLTVDSEGGFYFTDSVRHTGAVYYVIKAGSCRLVARDLDYPNGVALSADGGHCMWPSVIRTLRVVIDLEAPGVASGPPRLFA